MHVYVYLCMCTWVCAYVRASTHMHVYVHMCTCMYACVPMCTRFWGYVRMRTCMYNCLHKFMHIYVHVRMCTCICVRMYVYLRISVHVYVYVRMFTCMYTCTNSFTMFFHSQTWVVLKRVGWLFDWRRMQRLTCKRSTYPYVKKYLYSTKRRIYYRFSQRMLTYI